jgi:hypothetical protein
MKHIFFPLALVLLLACGCSHQYTMKLTNGMQISTPSKPKLKGANYHFKDAYGHDHTIPQSRVAEVLPSSMAAEEKKVPDYPKPKRHWWQFWRSSGA